MSPLFGDYDVCVVKKRPAQAYNDSDSYESVAISSVEIKGSKITLKTKEDERI